MERVQRIFNHPQYQQWLQEGKALERDRVFCRHDLEHCLAVGRIAYILWLEQQEAPGMKPLFYGAALLHDVGKWQKEQSDALGHAVLSGILAKELLSQCGFAEKERELMLEAILAHSGNDRWLEIAAKEKKTFAEVFYLADKLSRPCWECSVKDRCYWQVKNEGLVY